MSVIRTEIPEGQTRRAIAGVVIASLTVYAVALVAQMAGMVS